MSQREAFEAQDRDRYDIDKELYSRDHMDRYRDRPIQCRWETWQAAPSRLTGRLGVCDG